MTSKREIINRGLLFVNERPINNPDEPDTPASRKMVDIFDSARRELLRMYAWNFAEVWKTATRVGTPPEGFGYADAYALPPGYLRLLVIGSYAESEADYRLLYDDEAKQRVIAINNSGALTLKLAYIADHKIYPLWDPLAAKALSISLARDLAKSITGQTELAVALDQDLTRALKDAVGVDGQEQSIRRYVSSPVQRAREFGGMPFSYFTPVEGYYD